MPPSAISNKTFFVAYSTCEGTLDVSKQLTFQNAFTQRGAINRHKGVVLAQAVVVNGAGDKFLAGATISPQHHGAVGGSAAGDQAVNILHWRAGTKVLARIVWSILASG